MNVTYSTVLISATGVTLLLVSLNIYTNCQPVLILNLRLLRHENSMKVLKTNQYMFKYYTTLTVIEAGTTTLSSIISMLCTM